MIKRLVSAESLYYGSPFGLFVVRLGTETQKSNEDILNHVKKVIKTKVNNRAAITGSMYLLDNLRKAFDQIGVDRIVYSKESRLHSRAANVDFWQYDLVINTALDWTDVGQYIGGSYGSGQQGWVNSEWVEEGHLEIMAPDTKGKLTRMISLDSRETTAWYGDTEAEDFSHIPCMALRAKTSVPYKSKHKIKLSVEFYDNAELAIKDGSKNLICVLPMNKRYPGIYLAPMEQTISNTYRMRVLNPNKVYATFVGETLVLYNGNKSFASVMDAMGDDIRFSHVHVLQLIQYEMGRDIAVLIHSSGNGNCSARLRFIDGYKIDCNKVRRDSGGTQKTYHIGICGKGSSIYASWTTAPGYSCDMMNLVAPYYADNKEQSKEVLEIVRRMFNISVNSFIRALRASGEDIQELHEKYFRLIHTWPQGTEHNDVEGDILANWFEKCTRTTISNDEKIIAAYKNMKTKLERELLEIGEYVNGYDFSKVMPIPKVSLDKKVKKDFYKCISTDVEKKTVSRVMGKQVSPKEVITTQIRFMAITEPQIYVKNFSIKDLYDGTKNEIVLNYSQMKGATLRDKIENRR